MKVSQFSNLLENLASLFDSASGAAVGKDLRVVQAALAPFAESSVADFAKFLGQCEEFKRTGAVGSSSRRTPARGSVDDALVTGWVERIRSNLAAGDRGELTSAQIESFSQELNAQTKPMLDAVLAKMELSKASKKDAVKKITQMLSNQAEIGVRLRVSDRV